MIGPQLARRSDRTPAPTKNTGGKRDKVVFLSNAGEPFSLDYLTEMVRGYVDAAEAGKRGACHLFRHTMATLMPEGCADIRFIQALLGRADLKTTQIYTPRGGATDPQSWNRYSYVGDRPLMAIDPDGLATCDVSECGDPGDVGSLGWVCGNFSLLCESGGVPGWGGDRSQVGATRRIRA